MKPLLASCLAALFIQTHCVSAEPVSLSFYVPSSATTETSRSYWGLVKEFEHQNPDIHILFFPSDSYQNVLNKVLKKIDENKSAGVFVTEISELLALIDSGSACAFDELIDAEVRGRSNFLKEFIPQSLENSYGNDGKIYSMPLFRSTPSTYYNLDMLNNSGVNTSELPKDWIEFEQMLKTVKHHTNMAPLGLANTWYDWFFEAFVSANGGALVTKEGKVQFDSPAVIETLEYWARLKDEGLLERIDEPWKDTIHKFVYSQTYPVVLYSSGGMNFAERNSEFKWTVDIIPKNKKESTVYGGGNIFLSCNMTQNEKQAAWRFIKYILSPVIQARLVQQSGYFPIVSAAFNSPALRIRYLEDVHKKARKQLNFSQAKSMVKNQHTFRDILKEAINEVFEHGAPPHKALTRAQDRALLEGM